MKLKVWVSLAVALTGSQLAVGDTVAIRGCVSGFCVGDSRANEKAVVAKLGPGIQVHRPDDVGKSRCYSYPNSAWVDFIFAGKEESGKKGVLQGIMLTEQQLCEPTPGDRKLSPRRHLAGVSLGMSEREVLAARGKPSRIDDAKQREARTPSMTNTRYAAKFGDSVYVYDVPDSIEFTFVFFKDGRVRTIWFSSSE